MTLSEFTSHLEELGIAYKTDPFQNSVFITFADHLGYCFDSKGILTGGFIWSPFEDLYAEWEEWRLYLQENIVIRPAYVLSVSDLREVCKKL